VTELSAILAAILLVVLGVFQLALALGAPWGQAAWGGQHVGVLPTPLRIASGVAAVVIVPTVMLLVLAAAGLVSADWLPLDGSLIMWVLTGIFAVGSLMNVVSRSRVERVWGPVALILALCCAVIALGL
jgi:hypothetical protein